MLVTNVCLLALALRFTFARCGGGVGVGSVMQVGVRCLSSDRRTRGRIGERE